MFSTRRFLAVAKKEFIVLKRNILFFILTLFAPIMLFILFAFGFPLGAKNISLGVLDFDKTATSRTLIDKFTGASDVFNLKAVGDNYPEIEKKLQLGYIRSILVIPNDFSKDIKKGNPVDLQVLVDAIYPNVANIIGAYTQAILGSFQEDVLRKYIATHPDLQSIVKQPIDMKVSAWYNPYFRSEDFIIPGIIGLVMLFFPPVVATIALAREKETGSILNMYCSVINRAEYLLGKMFPYVVIAYINFLIFLVLSIYLFKVPMRGSLATLLTVSPFYIATPIGIGLLIAVLVKSQIAAILITFIVSAIPGFLYTGFMVPLSSMGSSAQITAYLLSPTYFIDMIRKIMIKGEGFQDLILNVVVLVVYCFIIYFLCIKLFKKRVG